MTRFPRFAVLAGSVALLACGDRNARPAGSAGSAGSDASNALRTRTAELPLPPSATEPPIESTEPLRGICVSGDPDRGDPWRVGGLDSVVRVPLTPIETLSPRDSARLVARLARSVDALPSDTGVADFRGLPVVVRAAWRLVVAPGDTVFVAGVSRRLPIESAPLEEQFTLVAFPVETPSIREPLGVGWHLREVGPEETLAPREPVAAWVGVDGLTILLAHEAGHRAHVEMLVRSEGAWRLGWTGTLEVCALR